MKEENENSAKLLSTLTSLRKSIRRLKQRKVPSTFYNGNSENCPNNHNSQLKKDEKNRKKESSNNITKRFSIKRKNRLKNKNGNNLMYHSQFDIVKWSSCESIEEDRENYYNSLRRSRGSLFVPFDKENHSTTTKIPQYCGRKSAENFSREYFYTNKTENQTKDESIRRKRKAKKALGYSVSLPNISETHIDDNFGEITMESDADVGTNCSDGSVKSNSLDKSTESKKADVFPWKRSYSVAKDFGLDDYIDHASLNPLNKTFYSSTPALNRPPVPSVPKPINRRDKVLLKSISSEFLLCKDLKKIDARLERTFSDLILPTRGLLEANIHRQNSPPITSEASSTFEDNASEEGINDKQIWMDSEHYIPVAIGEAVWDHSSLESDELSFSSGDVITVLFNEDENWWWGTHNGQKGWFPVSYVRLRVLQELDEDCNNESQTGDVPMATKLRSASGLPVSRNKSREQIMTVRAKCVEELLNTEVVYVKLLKDIIEGYVRHIQGNARLFTHEDKQTLFSNIEELYAFHQVFLTELRHTINMDSMETSSVGHVFLKNQNGFEIYSKYCNNQPRSSARLSMLSKEKKYNVFFETCRLRQNMIRLSLDGFLLSPVQRICKYPLQLKELLKHTVEDHPDYKPLLEARECMQNVASLINERKRRLENVNKLAVWQLSVLHWRDEDLVRRSSNLVYKGALVKVSRGKLRERVAYLFDHQFVIFRKELSRRSALIYNGRIDTDETLVENVSSVTVNEVTLDHVFRVWSSSRDKWYVFGALNTEDKESWLKAFEEERKLVREELLKGIVVLPEIRDAAMESATNFHQTGRKRLRRKSVRRPVSTDLDAYFPLSASESFIRAPVVLRPYKPQRNRSFRRSLQGTIFAKYL